MPSPSPAERFWAIAPLALRIVAEGGWLTVVYAALVTSFEKRAPVLGPFELAAFVAYGLLLVWLARQLPEIGPLVLIAGVALGGALGWLLSPVPRDMLALDPALALGAHPAGWLAGLAVLRGTMILRGARGVGQIDTLLAWGLPALALVWAVAGLITPSALWPAFAISALWGSIVFVIAALMAIGLTRLDQIQAGIADERLRRRLRLLVLAAGLGVLPVAIPFAILSGLPVEEIFAPIVGPLRFLIVLVALFLGLLAEALINAWKTVARPPEGLEAEITNRTINSDPSTYQYPLLDAIVGLLVLGAALAVLAYALYEIANWLIGRREEEDDEHEGVGDLERTIVLPERPIAPLAARRRRSLRPARDAVGAYVHALAELERHPTFARAPTETPGGHSTRVRAADMPAAPDLARLAADYQLARYGGLALNAAEDGRALSRLARLRRVLRGR